MIGYRQGFRADPDLVHAFDMATTLPAAVLRLADYGLAPGGRADLVVIPVGSVPEAVAGHQVPRTVLKRGKIVVHEGSLLSA